MAPDDQVDRLKNLEEEVGRLKKHSKDTWDKLQIILAVLVPLSIFLVGSMISTSINDAEIKAATHIADAEIKSAETIADADREVARMNAWVAEQRLIYDFLTPLSDPEADPIVKRFALEFVVEALPKRGKRIVEIFNETEATSSDIRNTAKVILLRRQISEKGILEVARLV